MARGGLQYVLGAVYRDLHQDSGRTITVADLFGLAPPLPLGASTPAVIQDTKVRFRESEIAAFGELTYTVVPKVKLAAGARVFAYRQREASRRYGIGGAAGGDLAYDYDERNRENGVNAALHAELRAEPCGDDLCQLLAGLPHRRRQCAP